MSIKLSIPIYLVSLEQDIIRRQELAKCFPKHYSDFIHINAVDGRQLSAKEYYDATLNFFQKHKRPMSPAELGCSLSHIKALKHFLESNKPFALILEDDVIGSDSDLELIQEIVLDLSEHSLLLCGGQEGLKKRYRLGKNIKYTKKNIIAVFSYSHVHRTCCYIVSRKSAQQVLKYHQHGITLADKWDEFFIGTDIKIYYANMLQHPKDLNSSHIERDRKSLNDKTFLQKLLAKDGLFKVIRRLYWEVRRFGLIIFGYKEIK